MTRITWDHVDDAKLLARQVHSGQTDKAGRPYIEHPAAVCDRLPSDHPLLQTVGWLHDVVEDSRESALPVTLDSIKSFFGTEVHDAIDAITHRPGESRDDYYARVAANFTALRVKVADLGTNTDPWRTRLLEPELRARLATKYAHAYDVLGLTPPAPLVPDGRIAVTVGDIARHGRDEVIIAWVGHAPEQVTAVFTACHDGQFRGTAATPGLVQYHGLVDDLHLHSLPGEWVVTDPQWDLG